VDSGRCRVRTSDRDHQNGLLRNELPQSFLLRILVMLRFQPVSVVWVLLDINGWSLSTDTNGTSTQAIANRLPGVTNSEP
jgi:hypothetical protein